MAKSWVTLQYEFAQVHPSFQLYCEMSSWTWTFYFGIVCCMDPLILLVLLFVQHRFASVHWTHTINVFTLIQHKHFFLLSYSVLLLYPYLHLRLAHISIVFVLPLGKEKILSQFVLLFNFRCSFVHSKYCKKRVRVYVNVYVLVQLLNSLLLLRTQTYHTQINAYESYEFDL